MTRTNLHNNAGVQKYEQEKYRKEVSARWNTVMKDPRSKGREDLAQNLLSLDEPNELTVSEILAALEKAPAPATSSEPIIEHRHSDDPLIANFGAPKSAPGGTFDPVLLSEGEKAAKWLLNKS